MWLAGAIIALSAAIGIHIATNRIFAQSALIRFAGIGSLIAVALIGVLAEFSAAPAEMWAGILFYTFGSELYIFIFTLSLYSVSVNLLVRLQKGAMTEKQISAIYDSTNMVERRIGRLIEKNLLSAEGGSLRLTRIGQGLATAFRRLADVFGTFS